LLRAIRGNRIVEPDEELLADRVAAIVDDELLPEMRVRDVDELERTRDDLRRAEPDALHAAEVVADADPVAGLERLLHLQREPAEHVPERLLEREADDGGHESGRREERRDRHPEHAARDHHDDDAVEDEGQEIEENGREVRASSAGEYVD